MHVSSFIPHFSHSALRMLFFHFAFHILFGILVRIKKRNERNTSKLAV